MFFSRDLFPVFIIFFILALFPCVAWVVRFFTLKEYPHVLQGFICWPIATLRVESAAIALLELYDDPPSSPSSSSLFVNCVLSILSLEAKLQFDIFYIYSSHNMFRGRASCSRGGFRKTDKTFQQTKNVDIFWPLIKGGL